MDKSMIELIELLESLECRLFVESGRLKLDAPKGVITEEIKTQIKVYKNELVEYLSKVSENYVAIPIAPKQKSYPVSFAQRRLWILSQFEGGSVVYNIPSVVTINTNFEKSVFEATINSIIQRHEILRTVFRKSKEDQIHQFILMLKDLNVHIDFKDFSEKTQLEAKELFESFLTQDSYIPFDLEEGPLFRISIIQITKEKAYLYFNMHHIISDGWSMSILLDEVMKTYYALKDERDFSLPELPIQYKDYSVWQLNQIENGTYDKEKLYWKSELSGELPLLNLPTEKTRPKIKTNDGESLRTYINIDQTARLSSFIQEQGGSLFSVLLTTWKILFYRYTNTRDIIIGTPVSGRVHSDLEAQLGFYINTLALRTKISPEESFSDMNKRVRISSYKAFENQMYPFDCVVQDLEIPRDVSRSSVFDVLLTLQNISNNKSEVPLGQIDQIHRKDAKSKFDLEILIEPLDKVISVEFIYNTSVYERKLVEGLLLNFKNLLFSILEQPDIPISDLYFLSKKESQLLNQFNNSKKEYPKDKTILDLFKEKVNALPEETAVVYGKNELSYQELNEVSSQLADYLKKEYNLQPKDFVALKLYRSEWMLVSILAILKAGAAYLPIDPDYPEERILFIQEDSDYKLCIDEIELEKFKKVKSNYEIEIDAKINLSYPAYVIYTSGSTGMPKGVVNHHAGIYNRLMWKKEYLDVSSSDVVLQKTPFTFDVSVWELLLPMITGCKLVFAKPEGHKDPVYLQELIIDQNVTIVHFVPSMLGIFLQNLNNSCISLSQVVCSGEALPEHMIRAFRNKLKHARIHNLYGPTEATIDVTAIDLTSIDLKGDGVTIGSPVANTSIYVVDQHMQIQPIGVPGELLIGGVQVSYGYLNRPELNKKHFVHSPFTKGEMVYKTGDEVIWLPNGTIRYIGRKDHQVKIRGQRIELGEIEHQLKQKEAVQEVVVLVQENQEEKELVAFLVSEEMETAAKLQVYLSNTLPGYMVPSKYYQLDSLPLTPNGKVDRNILIRHKKDQLATGTEYVGARNEMDSKIIAIWENSLQHEKIGILDNYFALGGDSIKAISIIIKINKILEITIGVSDLYQHQTIENLVDYISGNDFHGNSVENLDGYDQIQQIQAFVEKENEAKNILPLNYKNIYPLVPIEEGMIFSSLLRTDEPIYYDRFVFMATIEDVDSFKSALKTLVKRHSILRTLYYMEDFSQPVKVVLDSIDIPMLFIDLTKRTKEEQSMALGQIRREDLEKRLTFNGDLLYNFKFVQLRDKEYYIVWNFHHAILDGWSVAVFTQELTLLLSKDKANSLPELPYSYKDYCAGVIGRSSSKESLSYWKDLLNDYSRNKLPFNFKGVKISEELGMKVAESTVNETTLRQLVELSERIEVSFKAICLAAHTFLMHIICSEKDVVTGVVSHDRPELEQSERILGCFLNTIPIRVNFDEVKDVSSLIKLVNHYLIYSKKHETHLSHIARSIEEKTTLENPIFDTLFNYMHFHVLEEVESNAEISSATLELDDRLLPSDEMTNTLFDFEVNRKTDGLKLRVKYTPSFFTEEDARDALKMYARILDKFIDLPTLGTDMVINEEDYQELIYDYNDTIVEEDKNIPLHRLFEEQSIKTPDNIALVQNGATLTYKELNERSNEIAHYLIKKGVVAETNVGLLCTRSFDMIIGLFGILKSGGSYVPIDPEYPLQRQEYIIENSKVDIILTNYPGDLEGELPKKEFIGISDIKTGGNKKNPKVQIKGDQLAYTIYTSGSTGNPKGVMIDHYSAVNLIRWVNETFSINEKDRLLFITSVCFDLSVYDIFGILASGGGLVIAQKEEVQDFNVLKELLIAERITFWDSVPTTFNYLVDELEEEGLNAVLPDMRLVFMSGDWIPVQLPERARRFFPNAEIISLGGATEGTVWSNYYPINKVEESWSSIPYGKPIRNNFFYILDDNLQPVPKGTVGELCIGGIGVARGYDNDPEKTRAAFVKDPFTDSLGGRIYKTGDLGRWMRNGNMEFLGRKDNQVKIRGFRVELGEIESTLSKHGSIKEAIVNVVVDKNGQNQLCAYLVSKDDYDRKELKSYLKDSLPEYMVPSSYVILDALPLNSNGKIDRKALPEPDKVDDIDRVFIAAQTEMQKSIEAIWKGILRLERIGINDDLFELGANSLSVASFVARFHKKMEYSIGVREVFHNPSIQDLAELVSSLKKGKFEEIEKATEQDSYPLSDAQRRLWVISQFKDASIAYNIPSTSPLHEVSDIERFKRAIHAVIDRHEILRTVFKEDDKGEIRQWIVPSEELAFEIGYEDFRQEGNKEKLVEQYIEKDANKPFDLEQGPLLRASLLHVSDDHYVFYYNIHHTISDGWSMEVLFNDVMAYYNTYTSGEQHIEELRIQYKDYALWQLKQLEEDSFQSHQEYWLSQIQGDLPLIDLPTSKKRPVVKTNNGAALETYLSKEVSIGLKDFSVRNGGTLFMGLLASLKVLFYRYTGQDDIIIGSPVAGREHQDLENQIGFYVNTLALRNQLNAEDSFEEFFENVKNRTLEAYSHQMYPFDRLVEEVDLKRDTSRGAIFDVMMVLQNTRAADEAIEIHENLINDIRETESKTSKFDLLFNIKEVGNHLSFKIEYNTDVYDWELIKKFMVHYKSLLSKLLESPNEGIGSIAYLCKEEREKILVDFNNTSVSYDQSTVMEMVEDQASKTPDAVALVFENEEFTYREVNERSNQLAAYLRERHKVTSSDNVGVMLARSIESVISMIGVMKSGACYVPIDPDYPIDRIAYIIEDAAIEIVLVQTGLFASNELKIKQTIDVNALDVSQYAIANPKPVNNPEDGSFVIYTSGSTGNPKGVKQTHRMMSNLIQWGINDSEIEKGLKHLQYASFSFDASLHDIYFVLSSGGTVYVANDIERLDYQLLKEEIIEKQIEVLSFPFSALNNFFNQNGSQDFKSHSIKYIISTAEQLYVAGHLAQFMDRNPDIELHNHYGPSETHVVTAHVMSAKKGNIVKRSSIGKPISNTDIYILDQGYNPVPIGITGEIYIGGYNLAAEYLNLPEETNQRFIDHPFIKNKKVYKTGDLALWNEDGTIEFLGRNDKQVKVRGYRIELGEIEHELQKMEGVNTVVVIMKDINEEPDLVAYLVSEKAYSTTELRHFLSNKLPKYMLPSHYVQLEELPLTSNGKIDKKSLPHPKDFNSSMEAEYVAPRNEMEERLVSIWEEVLQKENIGIKDDFFDLGGHSIKAVRITLAIHREFNVKVEISKLFTEPNIAELAIEIENLTWQNKVIEEEKVADSVIL